MWLTFHSILREVGKEIVDNSELSRLRPGLIRHLKFGYSFYVYEWERKGAGDRFTLIDFPQDLKSGETVEIPHMHMYEPYAYGGQEYSWPSDKVIDTSDDSGDDLDYEYDGYEESDTEDEQENLVKESDG
uniref:Uncharacterized protein n=1 Tax=Marseillevirus LCMAC101 TaxID=2506602 RepID=A0A481YQI2_9VIRU|nr:MAG: hypothetical protein LCMAC101_00250 [Marseillevirus LCMAC101]